MLPVVVDSAYEAEKPAASTGAESEPMLIDREPPTVHVVPTVRETA